MTGENDDDVLAEALAERVLARFRSTFEERAPFAEDRALAAEIVTEARPAVHALIFAGNTDRAGDLMSLEHHESLAMIQLLGRRLAELSATPTCALGVVPSLMRSLRAHELALPASLDSSLASVCVEGYVRGREEKIAEAVAERAVEDAPIVTLGHRCVALFLRGSHDNDVLREIVERFGRVMFKRDAVAAIVDLQGLEELGRAELRTVLSADETAKMLGARCLFVGLSAGHEELTSQVEQHAEFSEALAAALAHSGMKLRPSALSWFRRKS